MNNRKDLSFRIIRNVLILLFVEGVIFFIFSNEKFSRNLYGLVLGGFLSIMFFKTLEINIERAMGMSKKGAERYMAFNYFLRYLIAGLALYVAAKADHINILTLALALLSVKIVIYLENFYHILKSGDKKTDSF